MNPITNELLAAYGWNEHWRQALAALEQPLRDYAPARVVAQFSHSYNLMTADGSHSASVTGKFEFLATKRGDYPAVGDWVLAEPLPGERRSVIHAVLPRRSAMVRKVAGAAVEDQIVGANLDYLFIVNALNQDFNLRKIERYMIAAWDSGAAPVVLLTKADLCADPEAFVEQVGSVAPGVPVHCVSALTGAGKEALDAYLKPGATIGITGSSGVGKSTLLNWLAGRNLQSTQGIREDDARGRHTTTHRELFLLDCGALVMDTPGMRELQLWDAQDGWQQAFADIERLAASCRFRDCKHDGEAGCAMLRALGSGELDPKRYANYRKTEKELAHLARKERTAAAKAKGSSKGKRPPSAGRAERRPNRLLDDRDDE
ncbi:ribosome small subunit-dependent GTPase A [Cohnella cellulosilytica]|uniref:Small ribosomal subunit biogenesis GTPase RsgA n=1 Tax=Cohnella cellulosilytica TaxID=986710 RepID=A0ABW2F505_9BACL